MSAYKHHKTTARQRNLVHELTETEYWQLRAMPCYYCSKETDGGIDRKDPKVGYTRDNCVPSCKRCNARKSIYESGGWEAAIEKTKELAHRNNLPPQSQREWAQWGFYKAIKD